MGSGGSKTKGQSNKNQSNNKDENTSANKEEHSVAKKDNEVSPKSKDTAGESNQQSTSKKAAEKPAKVEKPAEVTKSPTKTSTGAKVKANKEDAEDEVALPEDQQKFDTALRCACNLLKPDSVLKFAKKSIGKLELSRALPPGASLFDLTSQLKGLQILDISGNQLGSAGFCTVMLSLCQNSTITTLNIADNRTDTDCAVCVGELLSNNQTLTSLNVSGNYLGKDYFSRCVGAALTKNTTLKVLKCESIGSTDFNVLGDSLKENKTLSSLNVCSNELSNAKTFVQGVVAWIKNSDCVECIELRNTGMKSGHVQLITEGLHRNNTIHTVNVSANQVGNSSELLDLVLTCIHHTSMRQLVADDVKMAQVDVWKPKGEKPSTFTVSKLEELSLSSCSLNDGHWQALHTHLGDGVLSCLHDLHIGNNPDLSVTTLKVIQALTSEISDPESSTEEETVKVSSLRRLNVSHNNADNVIDFLQEKPFSNLDYLNLRRCKVGSGSVGRLQTCIQQGGVQTLVLDGIKFSGTDTLQTLFGDKPKLAALSLSNCQLNDSDLQSLWDAIKTGLPMTMLKLSANRITDQGVNQLCEALQGHKTHPLALIDLSTNNIETGGGKRLSELLLHKKHRSQIHSVNMSNNAVGGEGVLALVSCITKSSLLSLNVSNQTAGYGEEDMNEILTQLCKTFGIKLVQEGGITKAGVSDLPQLPAGLSIKLHGLGGEPGELGGLLDSAAITTDYNTLKVCSLTLQDVMELSAGLKLSDTSECLLSSNEWDKISGLNKDAPSWLRISDNRNKAVYMTGLPASITTQKMEGLLEMEADCNVDEVCLMKDTITRKNNGCAWVLLSDVKSAEQALDFYKTGQARVFSQPFTISRLHIKVDDEASSEADEKAKQDLARRQQEKQKAEAEHSELIQRAYVESQERHAYRLAHPAYADGRIW